ncbi:MAG: hypothetical protein ABI414_10285 [Devosia sp.]
MTPARLAIVAMLVPLLPVPAMAQWMTFVGRNVDTGERLGLGARVVTEGEDPRLAILCTPDGLTATYDTGFAVPPEQEASDLPSALLVGADGAAFDPFPAQLESFNRGERTEMRLRLETREAMALAEYVLGATETIQLGYRLGDDNVMRSFSNDSAPVTVAAVLTECQGRTAKSK